MVLRRHLPGQRDTLTQGHTLPLTGGDTSGAFSDYSRSSSYPLFLKWQELSRNASTAGKIMNLIWADLAANNMVSAKSLVSQPNGPDTMSANYEATLFNKSMKFNYLYGRRRRRPRTVRSKSHASKDS